MSYESLVKDTFVHMLSLQMKQPNLSPIILQRVAEQPCIDIRQKLKYELTTFLKVQLILLVRFLKIIKDRIVDSNSIPRISENSQVAIWRGDITQLRIEAIVNAANQYMLGCFSPNHPCIDNQIHAQAGPRLRQECRRFMKIQNSLEPTGKAKITKAFNLPSNYILHTVGPIYNEVGEREDLLESCYIECLNLAKNNNIKSIAFCCISTGIFGYPQVGAAKVALKTVKNWMNSNPNCIDLIVFNVWKESDLDIYNQLVSEYF